jgi:predicted RNA-binding protein
VSAQNPCPIWLKPWWTSISRRFWKMCEANAFFFRDGEEELLLEGVDVVQPEEDGQYRLINIFGEQKIIKAKLKGMELVNHRIIFEE